MGRRTFARQLLLLGTRVAVILISLVVFRNPLTPAGALGSAVAIGGVFLYSLAKARC
ncbi:hypothetical protein EMIHUDRAFT_255356 [Emiliania huxleyi CCMP1516]|uniref:Sugar phosphate transporter domain-containing protein n=2 Tax=Emiliania huxleyi TaxID=2903 RepID=A0A0D3JCB7_EMIH1|nr:hypothetical protein EMIHUDRAFT_255356 [Emiliania huxleyi CCMP1516]EOD21152.1 hypothetical protein EMIHUDRAFT_255356 [Emiliania huxleyi CCMP1516]|eukprot:XP_005773581.1 hypothetical protein EMIHUDRAFT_255356 [Emiliania huxleyi CCMP1516]